MSRSSAALRLSSAASKLRDFADTPFLAATRDALPWSFVALLVAFLAVLILVPADGPFFGPTLGLRVASALLPAFTIMGAVLAPTLGFRFGVRSKTSVIAGAASCLISYVVALPAYAGDLLGYLRMIGPSGLFLALVVGLTYAIVTSLSRNAWIGAATVVAFSLGVRLTHFSLTSYIQAGLHPLSTLGDTYVALLAIVVIETLLWSVGIHGPAMLAAAVTPVYLTLQMQNSSAFAVHQPLPHIVVVSLFLFVFPGGAGATLPLAALFAVSRVAKLRSIGRMTIVPSLFNTNEPLLFGAPVVFNPYLIPPFIVVPIVLASTTYFATLWNWVARPAFYVPSSIPTVVSTFLATFDVRAIGLALINLAIATCIYFPFVRAYERHVEGV